MEDLDRHTSSPVWEARQVYEGEGLMVKDLLRGEERFVHEVKGSRTVKFREALLGRVVDHEGLSVFCGVFPRTLPPREADLVARDGQPQRRANS